MQFPTARIINCWDYTRAGCFLGNSEALRQSKNKETQMMAECNKWQDQEERWTTTPSQIFYKNLTAWKLLPITLALKHFSKRAIPILQLCKFGRVCFVYNPILDWISYCAQRPMCQYHRRKNVEKWDFCSL